MKAIVPKELYYYDANMEIITEPQEGDFGYVPELNKSYKYTNGQWEEFAFNSNIQLSMYDVNKQIVQQLPSISSDNLEKAKNTIKTFVDSTNGKYYMLLCKDISYFTVFNIVATANTDITNELLECAMEVGVIKSIEITEDKQALEIWVSDNETNNSYAMYFFNYTQGVVDCAK
jgi:hypothetical protein